jgi:GntR family transcriptional repressor for pyruvate dehydrogenase complex
MSDHLSSSRPDEDDAAVEASPAPDLLANFVPLRPRRTFQEIVSQISDAIVDGKLGIGAKLPSERELTAFFGVSRATLREALRVLETLGVLTVRQGLGRNSGYTIGAAQDVQFARLLQLNAALRQVPLLDLIEVREALEGMTIAGACLRASPYDVRLLIALIDEMAEPVDPYHFLELDTAFHMNIASMSGNSVAPLFMQALRSAIAREMLEAFNRLDDWESERATLVTEHRHIVDIIASHDAAAAPDAIKAHLEGFYLRMTKRGLPADHGAVGSESETTRPAPMAQGRGQPREASVPSAGHEDGPDRTVGL